MTIREEILTPDFEKSAKEYALTLVDEVEGTPQYICHIAGQQRVWNDYVIPLQQVFNRRLKELTDENESLKNAIRTADRLAYGIAWDTEKSERRVHEEKIKELEGRLKEIAEKAWDEGQKLGQETHHKNSDDYYYMSVAKRDQFLSYHGLLTEDK